MKQLYIDAIIGIGFTDISQAMEAEQNGFANFCGNQHNPEWEWVESKLQELDENKLRIMYNAIKKYK